MGPTLNSESPLTRETLAKFHDAELQRVVMDREQKTLTLAFNLDTGLTKEISFSDVLAYKITDIYSQNVVSRLLLSSVVSFDSDDLDRALALIFDRRSAGQPNFPANVKADIQSKEFLLFYLDPSVGAEAAIVAKKILIS